MRLDKYLAGTGVGTRTQVKQMIRKGLVQVGGEVIKKPETNVREKEDEVLCCGERILYETFVYYMLNKPAGVVSATKDNFDTTVLDLIQTEGKKDIAPVGRLDKDTEGLLLLTNDGQLSHNLLSPKKHVEKEYYVILDRMVSAEEILRIEKGVDIGGGETSGGAALRILNEKSFEVTLSITEGRFHEVKRIFQAIGCKVRYLKRVRMGGLVLDADLAPGKYRRLTTEELEILQKGNQADHSDREVRKVCCRQRDTD